ncbi:TrmH family RNA methyltransferase [Ornithinimicrobium sufpigmenti]|uniref:TrmH family RNA methyltransferase n=1 Tax=Ornithinimicrobium sufpigmenti TaxID=2508882 RepID=UPI001035682D|nr:MULTISPECIES: TrmH family RNA methyltransferase [unclassified Ornithinimicrobium]
MTRQLRITRANAQYQQWRALLDNRTKRQRAGEFLVQGVRPITLAVQHGWPVRALIHDAGRSPSRWAQDLMARAGGARVAMVPELLRELGGKDAEVPEVVAVVELPEDDLGRIRVGPHFLGAVFDRPGSPGNIGTMLRSLDAFGGAGLVTTGHASDPYDPRAVRASTGSLFAVPVVRARSHREVLDWVARVREGQVPLQVLGTDEDGAVEITDADLTGPTLMVIGNETSGLSAGWQEACDVTVRIPMAGSASSLNAASAATVVLYEAARQRRTQTR